MSKGIKEEPPAASRNAPMIRPAEVMAERSVSELLETSQFLSECDMNTSELLGQLSDDGDHHAAALQDDAFLQRLFDSHDRIREQELLVEQPIYEDVISFPPPRMMALSGPARRTRSQTSASSYGQKKPHGQHVTVTPHDSTTSSMSSTHPSPLIVSTTATNIPSGADFTIHDVILGRGGKSNNHPGNQLYLRDKELLQPRYFSVSKREKTAIAQELVDRVHARGGRFMKETTTTEDDDDYDNGRPTTIWTEVNNDHARRKASQSLREISSKELRASKREKYRKHPPKQQLQQKQQPPQV